LTAESSSYDDDDVLAEEKRFLNELQNEWDVAIDEIEKTTTKLHDLGLTLFLRI